MKRVDHHSRGQFGYSMPSTSFTIDKGSSAKYLIIREIKKKQTIFNLISIFTDQLPFCCPIAGLNVNAPLLSLLPIKNKAKKNYRTLYPFVDY